MNLHTMILWGPPSQWNSLRPKNDPPAIGIKLYKSDLSGPQGSLICTEGLRAMNWRQLHRGEEGKMLTSFRLSEEAYNTTLHHNTININIINNINIKNTKL